MIVARSRERELPAAASTIRATFASSMPAREPIVIATSSGIPTTLRRILRPGGRLIYTAPLFFEEHLQPSDLLPIHTVRRSAPVRSLWVQDRSAGLAGGVFRNTRLSVCDDGQRITSTPDALRRRASGRHRRQRRRRPQDARPASLTALPSPGDPAQVHWPRIPKNYVVLATKPDTA
jgi:hypothetical protein